MEVDPSRCMGLFSLGMPLGHAINCVLSNFGLGNTLTYDWLDPLRHPLVIKVHQTNTRLFFSPATQEILKLTVTHPWPDEIILLQEQDRVRICSPDEPLTFDQLQKFPLRLRQNVVRSRSRCQVVCNGICFTFDPDTQMLKEISIFQGGSDVKPCVPPPFSVFRPLGFYTARFVSLSRRTKTSPVIGLRVGMTYCKTRDLELGKSDFDIDDMESIPSERDVETENFERHIVFGDSIQDILTALGAPEKSYYQEKPSRLLARNAHEVLSDTVPSGDLYLNYKSLGFDVVISSKSHEVDRIVLHSNFPGHQDFSLYQRCPFTLDIQCCCHHVVERKSRLKAMIHQILTVTPITKWTDISQHVLCGDAQHVAVLQRQAATNDPSAFPSSDIYVFDQLVFEVMDNQHIATVTVLPIAPSKTCSCGDKNPHQPISSIGKLQAVEDVNKLQENVATGHSVAFHIPTDRTESKKARKSDSKPGNNNENAFFIPLDDTDRPGKSSRARLAPTDQYLQDSRRRSELHEKKQADTVGMNAETPVTTDKGNVEDREPDVRTNCVPPVPDMIADGTDNYATSTSPLKLRNAHLLPKVLPTLPFDSSHTRQVSVNHKQLDESSVQAYCDGFSPRKQLSRSPPQHLPIASDESLIPESLLQQEQNDQPDSCTENTTDEVVFSGLLESQSETDMFFSAESSTEVFRHSWSSLAVPDPAINSLSSLISDSGKQDYVSWEDIVAEHTTVLCQLQQRAQAIKDVGDTWVSGNPSRAATMLCTPVGAWFEDAATENHQSSSLLDSDPVAAIDILDIFTTNDSHISVPVCVELLPTLVRFMAASSLIEEDGCLIKVFSIISLITKKFGRSVVRSTPGTTPESKQTHKDKIRCKEMLKTVKSQAQSMLNDMKRSKSNFQLLKTLQALNHDLTIIH